MIRFLGIVLAGSLITGCAPKFGEDFLIEPAGNVRWENSQTEIILGVLSLLGAPVEKEDIRIGTDLKFINKWHSDITILSVKLTLSDNKDIVALGDAKIDKAKPFLIESGTQKRLPLEFRIDPKGINANRVIGIMQSKRKLLVKGDALIEVWGVEKHYRFEKEASVLVRKALRGGEPDSSR
ncbi:MAG: hypothetical protein PHW64_01925 [Sulfuricurvum sp.]|nr:hypothetical protein [Sulfuricurvum sp.]